MERPLLLGLTGGESSGVSQGVDMSSGQSSSSAVAFVREDLDIFLEGGRRFFLLGSSQVSDASDSPSSLLPVLLLLPSISSGSVGGRGVTFVEGVCLPTSESCLAMGASVWNHAGDTPCGG